jgi:hypothetical protein
MLLPLLPLISQMGVCSFVFSSPPFAGTGSGSGGTRDLLFAPATRGSLAHGGQPHVQPRTSHIAVHIHDANRSEQDEAVNYQLKCQKLFALFPFTAHCQSVAQHNRILQKIPFLKFLVAHRSARLADAACRSGGRGGGLQHHRHHLGRCCRVGIHVRRLGQRLRNLAKKTLPGNM